MTTKLDDLPRDILTDLLSYVHLEDTKQMIEQGFPAYAIPPEDLPEYLFDSWFAYAHDNAI